MANIEYAHPFRSMIEGRGSALNDIAKAQAARQTNLDYKYNEWYQPLKQAEQQSNTGSDLLKQAASIAHYTKDYSTYNALLAHFMGVPLERLPQGYGASKGGAAQARDADLSTNLLPVPFSYGNVYQAGGVGAYPQVPGRPSDPELDGLHRQAVIAQYQKMINGDAGPAAGSPVEHMNPLAGIEQNPGPAGPTAPVNTPMPGAAPEQAPLIPMQEPVQQTAPVIPGANAAATDATKALGTSDAAAAYGIPTPAKGPSIFEGEYDPMAFGSG